MVSRTIKNKIKGLIGISDWGYCKKKAQKRIGKLIYRKKYSADDLIEVMASMGMMPGDTVFIHSSMMQFYNFTGTAEELIKKLLDYLTPEGTLVMPAFPPHKFTLCMSCLSEHYGGLEDEVRFDVNSTPSAAGYLTEVFRKYPGVVRSINIQHSVCAYGKNAEYLVSDHCNSLTCWDEHSPYFKLKNLDAKVFSLGLPNYVSTIIHCTESLLYGKYEYFNQFFNKEITYNYRDKDGVIGAHTMRVGSLERNPRKKLYIVKKYFAPGMYKKNRLSNLSIRMVYAEYTLDRFVELAKQGIVMYTHPDPKKANWTPLK